MQIVLRYRTVLAGLASMALLLTSPSAAQTITAQGIGGGPRTLSAADIAAMPRASLSLSIHGETHLFEGPLLATVLGEVDAPFGDKLRGDALRAYVLVTAADGYGVVLSLAEIDPAMSERTVLLADRVDGAPIEDTEGPYRLIVGGDARPARSARQVISVAVMEASDRSGS